jgi:hypothetical protein
LFIPVYKLFDKILLFILSAVAMARRGIGAPDDNFAHYILRLLTMNVMARFFHLGRTERRYQDLLGGIPLDLHNDIEDYIWTNFRTAPQGPNFTNEDRMRHWGTNQDLYAMAQATGWTFILVHPHTPTGERSRVWYYQMIRPGWDSNPDFDSGHV